MIWETWGWAMETTIWKTLTMTPMRRKGEKTDKVWFGDISHSILIKSAGLPIYGSRLAMLRGSRNQPAAAAVNRRCPRTVMF